jgi:hypothetical protein
MLELSFSLCPSLFELERLDEGEKPEEKPNHIPCHQDANGKCASAIAKKLLNNSKFWSCTLEMA